MNIVYISHGKKKFQDQTRFSILSLLHLLLVRQDDKIKIVVYTDNANTIPKHPLINIIEVSPDKLREYRGKFNYVHRIKLKILLDESRRSQEPFLYVDSDTRWRRYPTELVQMMSESSEDVCYMHLHENEGYMAPEYAKLYSKFKQSLTMFGINPDIPFQMWNAGAIGVNRGAETFFQKSIELVDFFTPRILPTNWIEQIAVSMVAINNYEMKALTSRVLHHYWVNSFEVPYYLEFIFDNMGAEKSIEKQAEFCYNYNWDESHLSDLKSQLKPKKRYMKYQNSVRKLRHKIKIKFHSSLLKIKNQYY